MPGTTSEPSVALSFANNFWGKEDAGVGPLLQRMHDAKTTCEELKSFYTTRAAIEDDFARKLLALSKKPLGSNESGSLRVSMDTMRAEVESMAKAHQSIAGQMKTELEEPLAAHAGAMRERRKIVQIGCEKLLQLKMKQTQQVNKTRDRYEQDCLKIKGYLAQGHMVMGQEEKKNKARLEKAQIALTGSSAEYEAAIKALEETTGRWNRDWKAACDKFQDLEEERIDFLKSSMWTFANIASTVCVSDDAACEKIRISLEDCEVEKDITTFIVERGTGQEIPDPPKFINFCRGDYSDDSCSEAPDENYRLAQFPRTGNPTFRSSSPNPSSSSGSDVTEPSARAKPVSAPAPAPVPEPEPEPEPQQEVPTPRRRENDRRRRDRNDPRRRAPEPQPSPASEEPPATTPSGSARSRRELQQQQQMSTPASSQRMAREQAQRVAREQAQAQANVQHNEYPLDGMTMYCRPGAMMSETSSANSSVARPSSSLAAESDYSNPTTVSSNSDTVREDEKQKRKSGIFGGNSPFRRKSKGEKDLRQHQQQIAALQEQHRVETQRQKQQAAAMPPPSLTTRNSWSPSGFQKPGVNGGNASPGTRQRQSRLMLGNERHESPEPIDPRASLALNIGGNVFDVSEPELSKAQQKSQDGEQNVDPIAQALAELKDVTKNSTIGRNSADRFFGLATPAPTATPAPSSSSAVAAAQRGTPPPTYMPKTGSLDLPPPAFTSAQMQQTTQRYTNQREQMFDGSLQRPQAITDSPSRNSSRQRSRTIDYQRPRSRQNSDSSMARQDAQTTTTARATSPIPDRSVSPRPQIYGDDHYRSTSPKPYSRSASPNPYTQSRPGTANSSRPGQYQAYSNPGSPMIGQEVALSQYRGASPAPSHHSQHSGQGGSFGSRGRDNRHSMYGGAESPGAVATYQGPPRPRSRSVVDTNRQYSRDGRPILNYARAMYHYSAIIPEELSFAKGDILAILRQQDDGWWEAEIVGVQGRPGLVPSNYLQNC